MWDIFNNNDDDNNYDDDAEQSREPARAAWDDYDKAEKFDPDGTLLIFGCELTTTDLLLAQTLLNRFPKLESACNVLRAADALGSLVGSARMVHCELTKKWNSEHRVGQQVQYWPAGRNGETYLSTTTSPAFDTPSGPCVIVKHHNKALQLLNVYARNVTSPEVF